MSLGDQLGFAGLIVGLVGIGVMYLWPTKKWIGWFCIAAAICLAIAWIALLFVPLPSPSTAFSFTVRCHDAQGHELAASSGKIIIELGTATRTEFIGQNGEADFKEIPAKFRNATVKLAAQVDGFDQSWHDVTLNGEVLDLTLRRAVLPDNHVFGTITPSLHWASLRVLVDGQVEEGKVDEFGRFEMAVKGKDGDQLRLKIFDGKKLVYDDYQLIPGPLNLKLNSPK